MGQASREKQEKREVESEIKKVTQQLEDAAPKTADPQSVIGALHGVLDKAVLQVYEDRVLPILNDMKAKTDAVLDSYAMAIRRAQAIAITNTRLHFQAQSTEELNFEKLFALTVLAEKIQQLGEEEDLQKMIRLFVEGALEDKVVTALEEAEKESTDDKASGPDSKAN